jgi:hypothetical protein
VDNLKGYTKVEKENGIEVEVEDMKKKCKYFKKHRAEMPKLKSVDMEQIKKIYPSRRMKLI